jgi:CHAD domain-containing protein
MTLTPDSDIGQSSRSTPQAQNQDNQILLFARGVMAGQLSAIEPMIPLAIEGVDIEGVHRIRVATRRMRTFLKLFREYLEPSNFKSCKKGLKKMGGIFGQVRDLDVFRTNLYSFTEIKPRQVQELRAVWDLSMAGRYHHRRDRMLQFLRGDGYAQVLKTTLSLHLSPSETDTSDLTFIIGAKLNRLLTLSLDSRRRDFSPSHYSEYHALRLDLKDFRYALEFSQDLLPQGSLESLLGPLTSLQDLLGNLNDQVVALDFIDQILPSLDLPGHFSALGAYQQYVLDHKLGLLSDFPQLWSSFIDSNPSQMLSIALGHHA